MFSNPHQGPPDGSFSIDRPWMLNKAKFSLPINLSYLNFVYAVLVQKLISIRSEKIFNLI